jgi:peptide chain release factor 2
MSRPDFWDKPQESQTTVENLKALKKVVDPWHAAFKSASDLKELLELLDENQEDSVREMEEEVQKLERDVESLEFQRLLSDKFDSHNAILSINAGAGGTESCDWAEMLLRMYLRWSEQHGYKVQTIDFLQGEEAGIKNTTLMIEGPYAYGYLKAESGVHRLVRISPFDANKRRHTSFASVDIIAEVDDIPEVEVKESEIRIDTYRAGGAGGQHVNKTASAVRLTHLATGIVVQCQNERSQHQNKMVAMKVLKARLYERYRKDREKEMLNQYGEKKDIAWGSQIRSYVFHPYSMVKDHRTTHETSNVQAVMDGDLDAFIQAYLKKFVKREVVSDGDGSKK